MIKAIALGATTGLTFAIVSESYRVVRGASRACPKCAAPVGLDGVFRGEREPRSLTFQWAVNPLEWMAKERSLRRRQCCGKMSPNPRRDVRDCQRPRVASQVPPLHPMRPATQGPPLPYAEQPHLRRGVLPGAQKLACDQAKPHRVAHLRDA
ncbi:hypothetical protein L596_010378 [Steinernema carpocapsae]|uniref:Uncharacterized protein n=1 Tax=Steinernema carpocapsae TaxID=34508 RepID=A0A4U5PJH5_STECR|nr:hypothetical protein L596_010378 [Steinernema carpocapsae]